VFSRIRWYGYFQILGTYFDPIVKARSNMSPPAPSKPALWRSGDYSMTANALSEPAIFVESPRTSHTNKHTNKQTHKQANTQTNTQTNKQPWSPVRLCAPSRQKRDRLDTKQQHTRNHSRPNSSQQHQIPSRTQSVNHHVHCHSRPTQPVCGCRDLCAQPVGHGL
jgi:hypothetical protein